MKKTSSGKITIILCIMVSIGYVIGIFTEKRIHKKYSQEALIPVTNYTEFLSGLNETQKFLDTELEIAKAWYRFNLVARELGHFGIIAFDEKRNTLVIEIDNYLQSGVDSTCEMFSDIIIKLFDSYNNNDLKIFIMGHWVPSDQNPITRSWLQQPRHE